MPPTEVGGGVPPCYVWRFLRYAFVAACFRVTCKDDISTAYMRGLGDFPVFLLVRRYPSLQALLFRLVCLELPRWHLSQASS